MPDGVKLVGTALLIVGVILGLTRCHSERSAVASPEDTEVAETVPATAPAPTAAPGLTCTPLEASEAEFLISNADTGARNVPGPILGTAVVASGELVPAGVLNGGRQITCVALNVDGSLYLLAHPLDGLYVSLDWPTE